MGQSEFRALVVDDEMVIRQLTVRALSAEGFVCDAAPDGAKALELFDKQPYDVVVTDLRMPNRHGHALAVDLLQREPRPVIVILTGVMEPRLAKDLIIRGVDDIVFKPVDYGIFAAKVKAFAVRRAERLGQAVRLSSQTGVRAHLEQAPISLHDVLSKLESVSRILPLSKAALEVFDMVGANRYGASHLAAAIECDAALSAEVLSLANSGFYNPTAKPIVSLELAVTRIGQKRVGELALAASALSSLTPGMLPWMNVEAAWRRSVAAGIASDLLVASGNYQNIDEGVLLGSVMVTLGRVVLGTLYPKQYQQMVRTCLATKFSLDEVERAIFPETHARTMARLLHQWHLPEQIYAPLSHTADSWASLQRLDEPLRTRVKLVKLAIIVGQIAAGKWEPWDTIDVPQASLVRGLGIDNMPEIIEQTRRDTLAIASARNRFETPSDLPTPAPAQRIPYFNPSNDFDFLPHFIASTGVGLIPFAAKDLVSESGVLINALGIAGGTLPDGFENVVSREPMFVADQASTELCRNWGKVLTLPTSYAAMKQVCARYAKAVSDDDGESCQLPLTSAAVVTPLSAVT